MLSLRTEPHARFPTGAGKITERRARAIRYKAVGFVVSRLLSTYEFDVERDEFRRADARRPWSQKSTGSNPRQHVNTMKKGFIWGCTVAAHPLR